MEFARTRCDSRLQIVGTSAQYADEITLNGTKMDSSFEYKGVFAGHGKEPVKE